MDSSEKSDKSVTSPSADEIPKDIAAEFQRMSEDADALLQSIRNDEVQAATPRRGGGGGGGGGGGAAVAESSAQANVERSGSFDEDDDMTDELHHLETVPAELQRLQRGLDELDEEKLTELIHGNGEDEETFDPKKIQSSPRPSSSALPKQSGSCSASSTPHFALGSVDGNDSAAKFCQDAMSSTASGKPRQRKGAKSVPKESSSTDKSTSALAVAARGANAASSPMTPSSSPLGVMYPYDPAVAELRELMKAAADHSGEDDTGGRGHHPLAHVPSHGRVLKPAPKTTIESINWVLVAAFVVVWATVVVLMGRAHTDLLDEEGEVLQLPNILR